MSSMGDCMWNVLFKPLWNMSKSKATNVKNIVLRLFKIKKNKSKQRNENCTAWRKPEKRHFFLPNLFLPTVSLLTHKAHSYTMNAAENITCKNALVSCLEILFPYILYFKHAVEYASCKTLLAHTFIRKESALSNRIISACSFQSVFAAQRPWMEGCTCEKHRNTRHTWNSFHLQIPADVRQMHYPYAPVVNCKSTAAGMAAFHF